MKNKIFFLGFDIIPQSQDDRNINGIPPEIRPIAEEMPMKLTYWFFR